MRKAQCALCEFVGDSNLFEAMEESKELMERGLLRKMRPGESVVFCFPCRTHISRTATNPSEGDQR